MESIKIYVSKNMEGYSFRILPSTRKLIKDLIQNSKPAVGIYISYEIKSDFESFYPNIENQIYPALLGIKEQSDLLGKFNSIEFIDTSNNQIIHKLSLNEEELEVV